MALADSGQCEDIDVVWARGYEERSAQHCKHDNSVFLQQQHYHDYSTGGTVVGVMSVIVRVAGSQSRKVTVCVRRYRRQRVRAWSHYLMKRMTS